MEIRPFRSSFNALFTSIVSLLGLGILGCAEVDSGNVGVAASALGPAEDAALQKTLTPLRTLETPGTVYVKSIAETFATSGTFTQILHVYQADSNGEPVRFELTSKTSTGVVDNSHTFQSVVLTAHPGETNETTQTLPNGTGQTVYTLPNSSRGFYRFSFTYNAPNAGRTLGIRAFDLGGNALKIASVDPPSAGVQVRAQLVVEQAANAFLKGGAYRTAEANQSAFADNILVDGIRFYRRGFDQGRFNFPLGQLSLGEHTVEFSLAASGYNPAKFWFGINEYSFDPTGTKTSWAPLQFLYYGAMHTGDYDAWNDGVAFAEGPTLTAGVRPPPVRRGTTFTVAVEHPSLNGANANAILRIYPLGSGSATNWATSLPAEYDYPGAYFSNGNLSTRHREHWRITVPNNATIGRYVIRAIAPTGAPIGGDVLFYVTHNPYTLLSTGAITKGELETYVYDEDDDGVNIGAPFGVDKDNTRDHFTAFYDGSSVYGYSPRVKLTGAFQRTQDESTYSMLDYAVAAAQGTNSEFETMRRLYRIVSQRLKYNRPDIQDNSSISFAGGGTLDVNFARDFSLPGSEFPDTLLASGQCYEYGTILTALARSIGILSRTVSSENWLGGWGNHVFTEAYIPTLPLHGGTVANSNASAASDYDHWYTFDATDPNGVGINPRQWSTYSEAIAPRAQFGKAAFVLSGPFSRPITAVTTPIGWDPLSVATVSSQGVTSVSAAYNSGPEFWLTKSGVVGWLGFGEKDVYRINKETTSAKNVRIRTLPNGGEFLVPKLCVGSVLNSPIMPSQCTNAATNVSLPTGDSYVVVFNALTDQPNRRNLRGESIQYLLELEY